MELLDLQTLIAINILDKKVEFLSKVKIGQQSFSHNKVAFFHRL